jgi:hypothetical protein
MALKGKLLAGVTVSGLVLCLSMSARSHVTESSSLDPTAEPRPVSARADQLREKLRATKPASSGEENAIRNVVQFFNFFNCFRPGWRNC